MKVGKRESGKVGAAILLVGLLAGCGKEPAPRYQVQRARIVYVKESDAALGCGSAGYTIVEWPDGTRSKWCQVWGKVGDEFNSWRQVE